MEQQLYQIKNNEAEPAEGMLLLTDRTLGAWYKSAVSSNGETSLLEAYCTVSEESHAALEAHLAHGEAGDMLIATERGTLLVLCGFYGQTGLLPLLVPPLDIAALLDEPADLAPTLRGITLCPTCRRLVCYHTEAEHARVREWYASVTSLFCCDQGEMTLGDLMPCLTALAHYFGCTLSCEGFEKNARVSAPIVKAALLFSLAVLCRQAGERVLSLRWQREGEEGTTMCIALPKGVGDTPHLPERLLTYAAERGAILELYTPWEAPQLLALNVTVSSVQRSVQGIKQPTLL